MRTLIDGYNLMHARGLMQARFAPDGFRKARQRFLAELAAAMDPVEAHQTTVVFDASKPPHDRPSRQMVKGIEVVFAVGDENADERIEKLIAAHSAPKSLTVVSTDLRVRQAAERRRAKVILSDEFLFGLANRRCKPETLPPPLSAEEQARNRGLSSSEAEFWMAEFADVATEPGVSERLRSSDFVPTDEEIARIEREIREED
jgi:hypothetical protein